MTGPTYPRTLLSGIIGKFIIGVSPIGTIAPFDWWATIISQYANSPIITQLIGNFFDYVDQTTDFDAFFDDVFNIDTAVGHGLDVWGRILGVSRVIQVPGGQSYLGFEEQLPDSEGFENAPFFAGQAVTDNFTLTDDAFRLLLLAKAAANICDGSVAAINQLLLNLFPNRGNCYVTDGHNMTMTYTFEFELTPAELVIVSNGNVLPRPAGVSASVVSP